MDSGAGSELQQAEAEAAAAALLLLFRRHLAARAQAFRLAFRRTAGLLHTLSRLLESGLLMTPGACISVWGWTPGIQPHRRPAAHAQPAALRRNRAAADPGTTN